MWYVYPLWRFTVSHLHVFLLERKRRRWDQQASGDETPSKKKSGWDQADVSTWDLLTSVQCIKIKLIQYVNQIQSILNYIFPYDTILYTECNIVTHCIYYFICPRFQPHQTVDGMRHQVDSKDLKHPVLHHTDQVLKHQVQHQVQEYGKQLLVIPHLDMLLQEVPHQVRNIDE